MEAQCCVKECVDPATIRQPLHLGTSLVLYVPLCAEHSQIWEAFAKDLTKARERAARDLRDQAWLVDAAMAIALFPARKTVVTERSVR